MRSRRFKNFTYIYLLLALPISLYALSYFWHGDNPFNSRYHALNSLGRYSHFIGAGFALLAGALQMFTYPGSRWHRRLGYFYSFSVVMGVAGGCYLAFHSHLGLITGLGFFIADILWITFLAKGIQAVLNGHIKAHRRWMIRSMAMTTAGISLRIWLPTLCAFLSFDTSYIIVAWLSWIPNLIAVEIYFYCASLRSSYKTSNINPLVKGN